MNSEFTSRCARYLELRNQLIKMDARLINMVEDPPIYQGNGTTAEIDTLLQHYRVARALQEKMQATKKSMDNIGEYIIAIFDDFNIPNDTMLLANVDGDYELEITVYDENKIYIAKTRDLKFVNLTGMKVIKIKMLGASVEPEEDCECPKCLEYKANNPDVDEDDRRYGYDPPEDFQPLLGYQEPIYDLDHAGQKNNLI